MFAPQPSQPSLFGGGEPRPDPGFSGLERHHLGDEAWVDYCPRWLAGDETLLAFLASELAWRQPDVPMYGRVVHTPRLVATVEGHVHPVVDVCRRLLDQRYETAFERISAGYYRRGEDSVAWHGDRIARERAEAIVATVSLGGPRRFLLRPKSGGSSRHYSLGHGDLLVMGGTCQRTWEHTVPKVASAPPRIALMYRPRWDP